MGLAGSWVYVFPPGLVQVSAPVGVCLVLKLDWCFNR